MVPILQLKEKEYVEAAKARLVHPRSILLQGHLIPELVFQQSSYFVTLGIPNAIMYEASLSFLGLGVKAPMASWVQ